MRPWPVLGLALILGPLLVNGLGRSSVLPAGSGTACASNPPQTCVQGAYCATGGCLCRGEGNGDFVCYDSGVQRLEIKDGLLQAWDDNITTAMFLPCRVRLTAFETAGSGVVSSCFTQIFSLHRVEGGRTVLFGVDAFFHVTLTSNEVRRIGFRITGTLANGFYSFEEFGTNQEEIEPPVNLTNFLPEEIDGSGSGDGESPIVDDDEGFGLDDIIVWGFPEALVLPMGATISSFIGEDSFGVIHAPACHVTIKFRPSSNSSEDSSVVSGLSVAIDDRSVASANLVNSADAPTYVTNPLPATFSDQLTPEQSLISLALKYEAQQDGSNAQHCLASGYVYHTVCDFEEERNNAVRSCSAFVEDNLTYCLRGHSGPSGIKLFNACMQFTCKPNFATCSHMQSLWIPVTNCHSYLPSFVSSLQCDVYNNG